MTVPTPLDKPLSLASSAGSSEPLFSIPNGEGQQFSIVARELLGSGPLSFEFDWSDFPVPTEYNEEMPVPAPAPVASTAVHYSSSPLRSCSRSCSGPTMAWEGRDDDTSSFSISSDEDTIVEAQSEGIRMKSSRKSVTFSNVIEIISHNVVLGDHPCCSSLALSLGWEHQESEMLDFIIYESSRHYQRRHLRALRLSYWDRRRLLERSTGLSEQELLLQEQRAWRDQLDAEAATKDEAPLLPLKSCCQEAATQQSVLKKAPSTNTLSSLAS